MDGPKTRLGKDSVDLLEICPESQSLEETFQDK